MIYLLFGWAVHNNDGITMMCDHCCLSTRWIPRRLRRLWPSQRTDGARRPVLPTWTSVSSWCPHASTRGRRGPEGGWPLGHVICVCMLPCKHPQGHFMSVYVTLQTSTGTLYLCLNVTLQTSTGTHYLCLYVTLQTSTGTLYLCPHVANIHRDTLCRCMLPCKHPQGHFICVCMLPCKHP